ncbi:hypothetical protein A2153_03755 [Candidatus Gottesmanbacteria bacterium RBG_16_38_7b]|uniref:HYDIN/VesB/CFA65-like Ig-like domain-containing protein n=1 Tax=Candidatus Gottesmanbacteria bacterium RBG_16_38_7b TaxID=1798372 RepID=A0A1F5YI66_9BACT|nr:MAG: hypothetical protein A2153_03755 [Candidatus Gottesmanbacteria bacterium RBG_16_38_7b]
MFRCLYSSQNLNNSPVKIAVKGGINMKYHYPESSAKTGRFSTDKIILAIIGGLTVIALVVIVLFSANEQKQAKGSNIVSYTVNDPDKPQASVASVFSDLGNMKVKDEKSADFVIENSGNKPLQLFKVSSSCDCTIGKITIDGNTSPEFGMHSQSTWSGEIAPGNKATLSVIYRPYIMPVSGPVTREVYVSTNDPENKLLTFTVKAIVQ